VCMSGRSWLGGGASECCPSDCIMIDHHGHCVKGRGDNVKCPCRARPFSDV
jgi:hypothetical protein